MNAVAQAARVDEAEAQMLQMPQALCSVRHLFAPGLYIRELSMKAGTIAIGHGQRREQFNVLLSGRVRMLDASGKAVEIAAPACYIGAAGRKIGWVLEDVVWLNVYANPEDERDIETLERAHLLKSEHWQNRERPAQLTREDTGFELMLAQIGISPEQVRAESEREDNLCAFPSGAYKVKVGDSSISGRGLIATSEIEEGEIICPASSARKRTPAGRFTNHSDKPNAMPMRFADGEIYWIALCNIAGSHGSEDGEEITIDYRETFALQARGSV